MLYIILYIILYILLYNAKPSATNINHKARWLVHGHDELRAPGRARSCDGKG